MDAKTFFKEAVALASRIMEMVRPEDFNKSTPDTEWKVIDLVRHMLYELAWVADLVEGKSIAEVGDKYEGDLIGDDLYMEWQRHRTAALMAIDKADPQDIVHLSYGDKTVAEYVQEVGSDLAIHAWDLGEGIGREIVFEDRLIDVIYPHVEANQESMSASGLFAPKVDVPEDASRQTKLLALYGRSDHWNE